MFTGSIPALVTPFCDGTFSESHFRALVDWQIEQGSSALVPCGTTGEAPTLSFDEHYRVISICIEQAAGRVPVIAGCGSNDTATAVRHMEFAKAEGAAAALVVAPYYNRPNQDGIYAHYAHLAEKSDLPIIVYNVPARTVTDIQPATLARLAEIPTIVGVKDASGQIARVGEHRLGCGVDFCQLSGNDDMALAFNAAGGVGCISVTANVAPKLCAEFQSACANGDYQLARELNDRLHPLHTALFTDASPGPVKYAMTRVIQGFPRRCACRSFCIGRQQGDRRCGAGDRRTDLMARPKPEAFQKTKVVAENRRARYDYHIEDKYEAGNRAHRHRGKIAAVRRRIDRGELC